MEPAFRQNKTELGRGEFTKKELSRYNIPYIPCLAKEQLPT